MSFATPQPPADPRAVRELIEASATMHPGVAVMRLQQARNANNAGRYYATKAESDGLTQALLDAQRAASVREHALHAPAPVVTLADAEAAVAPIAPRMAA